MTGSNHGITGAAIALIVRNPAIAVPLSFASHFLCDALPHFGFSDTSDSKLFGRTFNIMLLADFLFAVCLMALFGVWFPAERWVVWACMIAAASPDLMWAYYKLYVMRLKGRPIHLDPLARLHTVVQWSQTPSGAVMEAVWFAGMFIGILAVR